VAYAVSEGTRHPVAKGGKKPELTAYVPKPMTSSAKAEGRFNKVAFVYDATKNEYICPAREALIWRFSSVEKGMNMHCYWSSKCQSCALKTQCEYSHWFRH